MRVGPLELVRGYPTQASIGRLYSELDLQRAVQAAGTDTPSSSHVDRGVGVHRRSCRRATLEVAEETA